MRGPTYLFAAALLLGGLMAFIRKGSYKSLLFSGAVALLLVICASVMHRRVGTLLALGECNRWGGRDEVGWVGWRAGRQCRRADMRRSGLTACSE